jgi:large subunit ribosomal protein L10
MPNQKKVDAVKKLTDQLKSAKSLILTDYQGLKVLQVQNLKKQLKEENGEYVVVKNTLFNIVAKSLGYNLPEKMAYEYPTAVLIANGDEISPLKKLVEFTKIGALPKIKFGFLGKDYLDEKGVIGLSKIPTKTVLVGRLLSSLNGPTYGMVYALKGSMVKMVTVLNNYKETLNK